MRQSNNRNGTNRSGRNPPIEMSMGQPVWQITSLVSACSNRRIDIVTVIASRRRRNIMAVKDQGWAWIIALACWICMFLIGGFSRSFGLLIKEIEDYLGVPTSDVLTVKTVEEIAFTAGGAVGVLFGEQFSCRLVVMVSGIIIFAGTAISSLLLNAPFMACTLGLGIGLSFGLTQGNLFLMIPLYFDKRRSLAYGLATTGSSIGQLTIPLLVRYVIDVYQIKGAFLIFAAIFLQMTVAGALLRPYTDASTSICNQERLARKEEGRADENGTRNSIGIASSITGSALFIPSLSGGHSNKDINSGSRCSTVLHKLKLMFDFAVLKNYLCLFWILAIFLTHPANLLTCIFIAVNTNLTIYNIDKVHIAILLSIVGGFDLLGRIVCGVFTNFQLAQSYKIMATACIAIGVNSIMFSFATHYWWMAFHCAIYGFCVGWYFPLLGIVSIDLMGVEQMAKIFSLLLVTEGIGSAIFVTLLGLVKDQSGSTFLVFILMGVLGMLGGVLLWCCPFVKRIQARRTPEPISSSMDETIYVTSG